MPLKKVVVKVLLSAVTCSPLSVFAAELIDLSDAPSNAIAGLSIQNKISGKSALQPVDAQTVNSLKELIRDVSRDGTTHVRYQQYYKGLPVFGHQVITHNKGNQVQELSGTLVNGIQDDIAQLTMTTSAQVDAVLNEVKSNYLQQNSAVAGKNADEWTIQDAKAQAVIYIDDNQQAREAVYVTFFAENAAMDEPVEPHFIIDAKTKQILKSWNGLMTAGFPSPSSPSTPSVKLYSVAEGTGPGGNDKMGIYEYGTDRGFLKFQYSVNRANNKICHLSNNHVELFDKENKIRGGVPVQWNCNRSFRHEGKSINGAVSPSNDALYNITFVMETYEEQFDERFLEKGKKLPVNVHYRTNYANAFWRNGTITLGDGDKDTYPLTSLDILAHEMSHGITQKYSNLVYEGASGGLNESFSDIAGKTIEAIHNGTADKPNEINWTIGAEVSRGEPIRYMDTPEKDGYSVSQVSETDVEMDPHHSSGVFNKAFYLMVHSKDAQGNYVGLVPMFEVFLQANKIHWESKTTFYAAAEGVLKAENDLYSGKYAAIITNAFKGVGINCIGLKCPEPEPKP